MQLLLKKKINIEAKLRLFFYRVTDITLDSKLHLIKAFGYFALVSKFMIRKDEIIIF